MKFIAGVIVAVGLIAATEATADILFEEVAQEAGLTVSGPTFGASWTDANGDGKPDLWVGNHARDPLLAINNGDGTFFDATHLLPVLEGDMHGTAWADYDNDGDNDALVMIGAFSGQGEGANLLFVNEGNGFVNRAPQAGLEYPFGRGRTPLWFDWNLDGQLDVVLVNGDRSDDLGSTVLMTQNDGVFTQDVATDAVIKNATNDFAQLADIVAYPTSPLLSMQRAPFPGDFYDYSVDPVINTTSNLGFPPGTIKVRDIIYEDFDGDLVTDVLTVSADHQSTVTQMSDTQLRFWMQSKGNELTLVVPASLESELYLGPLYNMTAAKIFIGASGAHPASTEFSIAATDTATWGVAPHDPVNDRGVYIGFIPEELAWRISVSGNAFTWGTLQSSLPVLTFQTEGFTPSDGSLRDTLFKGSAPGFSDATIAAGLDDLTPCTNAVAADFDNDMDLDLYLACQQQTGNLPNRLLENQGDGTFVRVDIGGVSEGTTLGKSDVVIAADYDADGYVDLFATNGGGADPFNDGPYQLFHNLGSGNHWIEIDLAGVVSNPHGIGARVFVTAGGKTQRRLVDGGMHRFAQNHMRLHFGLAANTTIESIVVVWPDGHTQTLGGVAVDQVLTIVEDVPTDVDADGILDAADNCLDVPNPDQCDTNGDGYGNVCDADINNNGVVNFLDLGLMKSAFLASNGDSNWLADADLNCNGVVNFVDLGLLKSGFLAAPGPSGLVP